jgi:hypothetical protein
MALLGGWEIDLATMKTSLSDEVTRIFGIPPGSAPPINPNVS